LFCRSPSWRAEFIDCILLGHRSQTSGRVFKATHPVQGNAVIVRRTLKAAGQNVATSGSLVS